MPKLNAAAASLALVLFAGLSGASSAQQTPPSETATTATGDPCTPNSSILGPPRSAQEDPNHRDWNASVGDDNADQNSDWMTQQQVARIVLYDPANFRGRRIGVTQDTPDLGAREFADIASSIRVYHGIWQLCSEANYGGVCRCYSSHTNTNRFGIGNPVTDTDLTADDFADTVASVRLVRRSR
jgi:hypothetical protein